MTSTLAQYFFVTVCAFFLASSLVKAGEHGSEGASKKRGLASVVKDTASDENVLTVPNEEGEKLIDTHQKLQEKLQQFKTGNISDSTKNEE